MDVDLGDDHGDGDQGDDDLGDEYHGDGDHDDEADHFIGSYNLISIHFHCKHWQPTCCHDGYNVDGDVGP